MQNGPRHHGRGRREHCRPLASSGPPPPHLINTKLTNVCSSFWKSLVRGSNHGHPPPAFVSPLAAGHRPKMLSSSDAKWRCMWHMLVWSVALTLVSQFLDIKNHIAFYILAAITMIVLPILTAIYNNTSGKHGSELLRVGYVLCDPVFACITVTPVLIFNRLPSIVAEYNCIRQYQEWNATYWCLQNQTDVGDLSAYSDITEDNIHRDYMKRQKKGEFLVIQASVFVPALLCLFMGTRSRKMTFNTHLVTFTYWLVSSIEAADLLEYTLIHDAYKHVIYTTEAIVAIVSIVTHSYAVVTLCSYISPMRTEIDRAFRKKYDFLYQAFIAVSGVLFTEIPLLAARAQIIVVDFPEQLLPGPFYMWLIKDVLFVVLLGMMLLCQKQGRRNSSKMLCTINLDTPNVVFQPEKRDAYIVKKKSVRFKEPLSTTYGGLEDETGSKDKRSASKLANNLSAYFQSSKSVSHESGLDHIVQEKNVRQKRTATESRKNGTASDRQSQKISSNPELNYSEDTRTTAMHGTSDIYDNTDANFDSFA